MTDIQQGCVRVSLFSIVFVCIWCCMEVLSNVKAIAEYFVPPWACFDDLISLGFFLHSLFLAAVE